jgi:hydroxymethylpyrimidine pyrophosphatase-like HAD family hydrolase
MLNGSGIGIAVGNATKEAKQAADIIIGDHNTSALADKLLELI